MYAGKDAEDGGEKDRRSKRGTVGPREVIVVYEINALALAPHNEMMSISLPLNCGCI